MTHWAKPSLVSPSPPNSNPKTSPMNPTKNTNTSTFQAKLTPDTNSIKPHKNKSFKENNICKKPNPSPKTGTNIRIHPKTKTKNTKTTSPKNNNIKKKKAFKEPGAPPESKEHNSSKPVKSKNTLPQPSNLQSTEKTKLIRKKNIRTNSNHIIKFMETKNTPVTTIDTKNQMNESLPVADKI